MVIRVKVETKRGTGFQTYWSVAECPKPFQIKMFAIEQCKLFRTEYANHSAVIVRK